MSSLANAVLCDWDRAMDSFFAEVCKQAYHLNLSRDDIRRELSAGYGEVVLESWDEWIEGLEE